MEGTMFTNFCRTQNLRILFTERNLPLEAHPIIEAFERRYKINVKGTILHDGSSSTSAATVKGGKTEQPMPSHIHIGLQKLLGMIDGAEKPMLYTNQIRLIDAVERFGQLFEALPSRNNAHVMFQRSPNALWSAGVLESLFTHQRQLGTNIITQIFAVIQEYEELSDNDTQHDLYRNFPVAGGHLCYNQLRQKSVLVPFGNIVGHTSHMVLHVDGVGRECLHVLPLHNK